MRLALVWLLGLLGLLCGACGGHHPPEGSATANPQTARLIAAAAGGSIDLPDGTRLVIPSAALPRDVNASLAEPASSAPPPAYARIVGTAVKIDLQGEQLAAPATLELPYDSAKLLAGAAEGDIFVAYYDDASQTWVRVPTSIDPTHHIVSAQITHASWWGAWSWLTDAIIQGVVTAFKLDFGSIVDAATAFQGCVDAPRGVIIDESANHDYLGSCVELDDPTHPRLRVVDRRTFDLKVYPLNGAVTTDLPNPGEPLGRLERRSFNVDYANAAASDPLIVRAEVDWPFTLGHAFLDILNLIPGMKQLLGADVEAKIMLELVSNSHILSAADAAASGDEKTLKQELFQAFVDANLVQGIGTLAGVGGSSLFLVFKGLAAAGITIQIADAAISARSGPGEVKFYSNRPNPVRPQTTATVPPRDANAALAALLRYLGLPTTAACNSPTGLGSTCSVLLARSNVSGNWFTVAGAVDASVYKVTYTGDGWSIVGCGQSYC